MTFLAFDGFHHVRVGSLAGFIHLSCNLGAIPGSIICRIR